ncbi:FadR/GntR family transcriptional regulator [Nonomuraea recticatena]|uniref:FadR/GntR family transcriptional regulator n=1 Tax=Nonomuraea recticatena TaxID=46178 RepID=UPI00361907DE
MLRPVRAGNAFEETVERLLQAIKLGMVAQGEKLPPERELAVQLGISRVTLREAIRALQEAGYLDVRRGRYGGAFVIYAPPPPGTGTSGRRSPRWAPTRSPTRSPSGWRWSAGRPRCWPPPRSTRRSAPFSSDGWPS